MVDAFNDHHPMTSQQRSSPSCTPRSAFTLTELLVVIAIIGLLLALVIVGFGKVKTLARVTSCLSQQRQIALAQSNYATDNNGAYASSRGCTDFYPDSGDWSYDLVDGGNRWPILINNGRRGENDGESKTYHSWIASYGVSAPEGSKDEFQYGLNSENRAAVALSGGRLYSYIGSNDLYKSPMDPTNRIRSYAFSGFVGTTVPDDNIDVATKWLNWFVGQRVTPREWRTTHAVHHKFPSQTIMTMVEDDTGSEPQDALDRNGWLIDPRPPLGSPAPQGTPNPGAWANSGDWEGWIDWPAFWDPKNITYSYADGSTESYSLQNPSLVAAIEGPPGAGAGHRYAQPADQPGEPWRRDWMHFRDRLCPGIIPPMTARYPGNPAP